MSFYVPTYSIAAIGELKFVGTLLHVVFMVPSFIILKVKGGSGVPREDCPIVTVCCCSYPDPVPVREAQLTNYKLNYTCCAAVLLLCCIYIRRYIDIYVNNDDIMI